MSSPGVRPAGPGGRDPYAPFRPRRGALVARLAALTCVAVFVGLAVLVPGADGAGWGVSDRVLTVAFGLVCAACLWRYSALRAIPSRKGLRVVNLLRTHDLEWAQVLRVGFSGGAPWVVLELTDTEEVAVMAIQRADGDLARAEAGRLSALVAHHTRTASDD